MALTILTFSLGHAFASPVATFFALASTGTAFCSWLLSKNSRPPAWCLLLFSAIQLLAPNCNPTTTSPQTAFVYFPFSLVLPLLLSAITLFRSHQECSSSSAMALLVRRVLSTSIYLVACSIVVLSGWPRRPMLQLFRSGPCP